MPNTQIASFSKMTMTMTLVMMVIISIVMCVGIVEIMRIVIIDDNGDAADDAEGGDDQNSILFSSHNISFVPAFLNAMHNVILFPSEPFV